MSISHRAGSRAAHGRLAGGVELPAQPQGEVGDRALPALTERRDAHAHGGGPIRRHRLPHGIEDLHLHEVRDQVPHERLGPPMAVVPGEAGEPRARMPERQHLRPEVEEPDVRVTAERGRQGAAIRIRRTRRSGGPLAAGHERDHGARRRIRPEQLQRQLLRVGGRDVVQRDDQEQPDREVRERRAVRERERIRGPGRRDLSQPRPDGRLPEVNPDDGHRGPPSGTASGAPSSSTGMPAPGARRIIWISPITSAKDP